MKRTVTAIILILVFGVASFLVMANPVFGVTITENYWVSKAVMHEGRTGVGLAVVNGKIYAIGGANQEGFRATNEEYDPAANNWTFKEPMPTPRSAFGIAVCQNKIYCIGGYIEGGATGANEVYDPATNKWENRASMPAPSLNLRANVANGKIYLIGGSASNGTLNQVYDPASNRWFSKASVPTAVSSYASAVVDNKIYVMTSNLTQIYDAENDSWSLGTPSPLPAILGSAVATTGVNAPKRIYVFGADADLPFWQLTTRKFTAQSYDPKADPWTVCVSMPTGRFDASAAVVDDKVYLIGGFAMEFPTDSFTLNAKHTYSSLNEQYTPLGFGNVPPLVSIVSPKSTTYNSSGVSLVFAVNKVVSWMGYSFDGQDNVTISGNFTVTDLSNGVHNVTVYANDTYGNMGASETVSFFVGVPEPFPVVPIAAVVVVAVVVAAGSVLYRKKRKQQH
jgi:N-acetylneuraminic acid mutarotase